MRWNLEFVNGNVHGSDRGGPARGMVRALLLNNNFIAARRGKLDGLIAMGSRVWGIILREAGPCTCGSELRNRGG